MIVSVSPNFTASSDFKSSLKVRNDLESIPFISSSSLLPPALLRYVIGLSLTASLFYLLGRVILHFSTQQAYNMQSLINRLRISRVLK